MPPPPPPPLSGPLVNPLQDGITTECSRLIHEVQDMALSSNGLAPAENIIPLIEGLQGRLLQLASAPRSPLPKPLVKQKSTGGPPVSPPPPSPKVTPRGPPRGPPPKVPAAVLEKAKKAAKAAGPISPPRGPPKPPISKAKPPIPTKSMSSIEAIEEQMGRDSETVLAADANRTSGGTKKKRFSGGVALFNPGIGALNLNSLKKVERSEIKPKQRSSQVFERPSLRHVATPSVRKLEEESGEAEETVPEEEEEEEEVEEKEEGEVKMNEEVQKEEETEEELKEEQMEEEIVWEQRLDPTHNVHYYLNVKTQEATWEAPAKFKPMVVDAVQDDFEWEERLDEGSGVNYYYNSSTQEATWTKPASYKPLNDSGEEFEWEQRLDPTHNIHYYLNMKTQEAVWEAPASYKPMV